jgi:WD40 repeat protein
MDPTKQHCRQARVEPPVCGRFGAYRDAILLAVAFAATLVGCASGTGHSASGRANAVAVSSDGRYAISSHGDNRLVLWNIAERKHRIISTRANIYSAYWVDGREAFLWQTLDDLIRVQSADGRVIKAFQGPPAYSHAIGHDFKTYVSTDSGWRIWLKKNDNDIDKIKAGDDGAFFGLGKPLNVRLTPNEDRALVSGFGAYFHRDGLDIEAQAKKGYERYDGVAYWNLATRKPIYNLAGNRAKTHATISPDGEYVVGVDENTQHHVWKTSTGEDAYKVSSVTYGIFYETEEGIGEYDDSGVRVDFPDDFNAGNNQSYVAVQFLDDKHYAAFHNRENYASLWKLGDPFALKFLDLGTDPFPSTARYVRNQAIDSAPESGTLVTGQRGGDGINVYRWDPDELTLEKVWAPRP